MKKKVLDIMTDLESLDNTSKPAITQISAIHCDIEKGKSYEEFDEFVSPMSSVKYGLTINGETVSWWMTQEKDAIQKVLVQSIEKGKDLKAVLIQFSKFLNDLKEKYQAEKINIIGNGTLADIQWLESAYRAVGLEIPWSYREPYCHRTLLKTVERIYGYDIKDEVQFVGIKHNAIDDCKHQLKQAHVAMKMIKKGKK